MTRGWPEEDSVRKAKHLPEFGLVPHFEMVRPAFYDSAGHSQKLFHERFTRHKRNLGTRKNRARVVHGSIFIVRQRYIHFIGSGLRDADDKPGPQRDVGQALRGTAPFP